MRRRTLSFPRGATLERSASLSSVQAGNTQTPRPLQTHNNNNITNNALLLLVVAVIVVLLLVIVVAVLVISQQTLMRHT